MSCHLSWKLQINGMLVKFQSVYDQVCPGNHELIHVWQVGFCYPPSTIVDMGDIVETYILYVRSFKRLMLQSQNRWPQSNAPWHHNRLGWGNANKFVVALICILSRLPGHQV